MILKWFQHTAYGYIFVEDKAYNQNTTCVKCTTGEKEAQLMLIKKKKTDKHCFVEDCNYIILCWVYKNIKNTMILRVGIQYVMQALDLVYGGFI